MCVGGVPVLQADAGMMYVYCSSRSLLGVFFRCEFDPQMLIFIRAIRPSFPVSVVSDLHRRMVAYARGEQSLSCDIPFWGVFGFRLFLW